MQKNVVTAALNAVGIDQIDIVYRSASSAHGINLNVGSGATRYPGFVNLDLTTTYYHPGRGSVFRKKRDYVEYDMRLDALPFDSQTVDLIYASHVIEHIETTHVERFIAEAARVLKPGGLLRVATPDALFLHEVSRVSSSYWDWRLSDMKSMGFNNPTAVDFLQREIGTANLFSPHRVRTLSDNPRRDLDAMIEGLVFDATHPGYHINWWSIDKLRPLAKEFSAIVESKRGASLSRVLQASRFDRKAPVMSLYCDFLR